MGPPAAHRNVLALGYHGAYNRIGIRRKAKGACSDFLLRAELNHDAMLRQPLTATGWRLLTFFHTYRSGCADKDEALLARLRPVAHEFGDSPLPKIVDSYLRVLGLIIEWDKQRAGVAPTELGMVSLPHHAVRTIVLCRFDAHYVWPASSLRLKWSKTNLAWRDVHESWEAERKASDLFIALPMAHAAPLARALRVSGAQAKHGPGHWLYRPLVAEIGEGAVHFIQNKTYSSSLVHLGMVQRRTDPKLFMLLDRSCEGLALDACVRNDSDGGRRKGVDIGRSRADPQYDIDLPSRAASGGWACWRGIALAACGAGMGAPTCAPVCNGSGAPLFGIKA